MEGWLELGCKGIAYGKEEGKNGTPHLQGFLRMKGQVGLEKMKELHPRAHWEVMKGRLDQNVDYCSKQSELTIIGKSSLISFYSTEFWGRVGVSSPTSISLLANARPSGLATPAWDLRSGNVTLTRG